MSKGKIFFVVGHRHWGKSTTLRALTNGRLVRSFIIGPHRFSVRRKSNDDIPVSQRPNEYYCFLEHLELDENSHVIATLCPTLWDKKLFNDLRHLKSNYQLFFFVLKHRWDRKREISSEEIKALRMIGTRGGIYEFEKEAGAMQRAYSLRLFIQKTCDLRAVTASLAVVYCG